jgi:SAM-dependent methyltransferase
MYNHIENILSMNKKPSTVLSHIKSRFFSALTHHRPRTIDFGNLDRIRPVSTLFGFDRGTPIDRYYIEKFLQKYSQDIRGHVLEIGDSEYTKKFGGTGVIKSDILHAVLGNPHATIIGDLATGDGIPENTFDCMILTQTLQFIYDVQGAIRHSYRSLAPGGVLLVTIPGISQISRYDMDRWGEYWRFTVLSAKKLFEGVFPPGSVEVAAYGNVLTSIAFLHGLATEELTTDELDYADPDYQMLITVRAVKPRAEG